MLRDIIFIIVRLKRVFGENKPFVKVKWKRVCGLLYYNHAIDDEIYASRYSLNERRNRSIKDLCTWYRNQQNEKKEALYVLLSDLMMNRYNEIQRLSQLFHDEMNELTNEFSKKLEKYNLKPDDLEEFLSSWCCRRSSFICTLYVLALFVSCDIIMCRHSCILQFFWIRSILVLFLFHFLWLCFSNTTISSMNEH